jgi:hypothetical protein
LLFVLFVGLSFGGGQAGMCVAHTTNAHQKQTIQQPKPVLCLCVVVAGADSGDVALRATQLPTKNKQFNNQACLCVVVSVGMCVAHNTTAHEKTTHKNDPHTPPSPPLAGNNYGSAAGKAAPPPEKAFEVFNALGAVAFAYNFSAVQLEIQVGV